MELDEILKALQKLATGKVFVLLVVLGVLAYFVHKNFDFVEEVTFKVVHPEGSQRPSEVSREKATGRTSLSVRPFLIPWQFDIPSYLLLEVANLGPAVASDVETTIDLGRARVSQMDFKPKDKCSLSSGSAASVDPIRVVCKTLGVMDSVEIYALLSEPTYRSILVSSPNIQTPISINSNGSFSSFSGVGPTTFADVLLIVVEGIVLIGVLIAGWYVLGALIRQLERIFGPKAPESAIATNHESPKNADSSQKS